MPSLLDTLRRNSQPQGAGVQDNTGLAATLQRAKSGRASTTPSTVMSNIGEQAAVQATNTELGQVAQQGALAAEQVGQQQADVQQAANQAQTEVAQARTGNQMQERLRSNELFNSLESSGKQLDLEKDRAQLEQLAHSLAMQDKQYVTTLQNEGQRKRLSDKVAFGEEMARADLGDGLDLFKQSLGNKSLVSAQQRDFTKALAQMDINSALEMAKAAAKASNTSSTYGALGGLASAGIAAAAGGAFDSKPQTTSTGTSGAGSNIRQTPQEQG